MVLIASVVLNPLPISHSQEMRIRLHVSIPSWQTLHTNQLPRKERKKKHLVFFIHKGPFLIYFFLCFFTIFSLIKTLRSLLHLNDYSFFFFLWI